MSEPITQTVTKNLLTSLRPNTFTNPNGLTFIGWNTNRDGSGTQYADGQEISASEEMTLYAQWGIPPIIRQVTWNGNGGTSPNPTQVEDGEQVGTLPTSTRSGYSIDGWFTQQTGGEQISSSYVVNQDQTFYAQWTGNTYSASSSTLRTLGLYIPNNANWSSVGKMFSNMASGRYQLEFTKMEITNPGTVNTKPISVVILAENAQNTSNTTYFSIGSSGFEATSTSPSIQSTTYGVNGQTKNTFGVILGQGRSVIPTTIRIKQLNLPYSKNNLYLALYTDHGANTYYHKATCNFLNSGAAIKLKRL